MCYINFGVLIHWFQITLKYLACFWVAYQKPKFKTCPDWNISPHSLIKHSLLFFWNKSFGSKKPDQVNAYSNGLLRRHRTIPHTVSTIPRPYMLNRFTQASRMFRNDNVNAGKQIINLLPCDDLTTRRSAIPETACMHVYQLNRNNIE